MLFLQQLQDLCCCAGMNLDSIQLLASLNNPTGGLHSVLESRQCRGEGTVLRVPAGSAAVLSAEPPLNAASSQAEVNSNFVISCTESKSRSLERVTARGVGGVCAGMALSVGWDGSSARKGCWWMGGPMLKASQHSDGELLNQVGWLRCALT